MLERIYYELEGNKSHCRPDRGNAARSARSRTPPPPPSRGPPHPSAEPGGSGGPGGAEPTARCPLPDPALRDAVRSDSHSAPWDRFPRAQRSLCERSGSAVVFLVDKRGKKSIKRAREPAKLLSCITFPLERCYNSNSITVNSVHHLHSWKIL